MHCVELKAPCAVPVGHACLMEDQYRIADAECLWHTVQEEALPAENPGLHSGQGTNAPELALALPGAQSLQEVALVAACQLPAGQVLQAVALTAVEKNPGEQDTHCRVRALNSPGLQSRVVTV